MLSIWPNAKQKRPEDDGAVYQSKLGASVDRVKDFLQSHTRPIEVASANLSKKPVAVIYNPTSGKGLNVRQKISEFLSEHGI